MLHRFCVYIPSISSLKESTSHLLDLTLVLGNRTLNPGHCTTYTRFLFPVATIPNLDPRTSHPAVLLFPCHIRLVITGHSRLYRR